jgi:hypothetical protein
MELFVKDNTNVFTTLLNCLGVKYTNSYANKLYNEHPHKYNLLGISKMLDEYNIKNQGYKIDKNKEELRNIDTPFIAHIGSDFVVVNKINASEVSYIWNKKKIKVSLNKFYNMWSGVILYAEPDENSIESNYTEHCRKELFINIQKALLILAVCTILIISAFKNKNFSIERCLLTIINLIGSYISYLLVLKQFQMHSEYADKICSLFKQNDCNDILELDVAKLGGIIGWSEIGLGYFFTNFILSIYFPDFIIYVAIINIFALPYTFWSIWFQKFKARQWCILCVIIQSLLWMIFVINITFNVFQFSNISLVDWTLVCLFYLSIVLSINILSQRLSKMKKLEQTTQELNSIKSDEEVFSLMLKKQSHYDVDKSTSSILWGNKASNILITVLTNPHCNPCAKMHKRIESILNVSKDLCIQYIFSSFNEDLNNSNKFLIAIYLNNEKDRNQIYQEWFTKGNVDKDTFLSLYDVDTNSKDVIDEFEKHNTWKKQTGLSATPTILINGYKLPDNYKIEDLIYLKYWINPRYCEVVAQ